MSDPLLPNIKPNKELLEEVQARAALLLSLWGIPSVLCFLAATVLVGLGMDTAGPQPDWKIISYGFGFGIVSLSALWTVLGPFRIFTRVPLAMLLAILAIGALAAFMLQLEWDARAEGAFLAVAAGGLQWMSLVAILILVRLASGSRVEITGIRPPGGNQTTQFGIRQLLLWTTGVALTLGTVRFVAGQLGLRIVDWRFLSREGAAFAILLGFNLILAGSIAWSLLATRSIGVRIAIASLIVVLATFAEPHAFSLFQGGRPSAHVFWWINAAGSFCLVVNLLIVRLCGFRLVRETGAFR